jgi:hypothetical protein
MVERYGGRGMVEVVWWKRYGGSGMVERYGRSGMVERYGGRRMVESVRYGGKGKQWWKGLWWKG